jgi:hypothetical protein
VRSFLLAYPGITAIRQLLVTYIGPDQVWVLTRVSIAEDLRGGPLTALVRGVESDMEQESPSIYRVDIVPVGQGPAEPEPDAAGAVGV